MKKQRTVQDVVNAILPFIPEDRKEVKEDLEDLKVSALYTAPEAVWGLWRQLTWILEKI